MTPTEWRDRLDAYFIRCTEMIAQHGWMIQGVFGTEDDPGSFAYTVGLTEKGLPEFFLDTLSHQQSHPILNAIATKLVANPELLTHGANVDVDYSVLFRLRGPVDPSEAHCFMALNYYEDAPMTVSVWQVLWPDANGLFPDEDGYQHDQMPQRLISLVDA